MTNYQVENVMRINIRKFSTPQCPFSTTQYGKSLTQINIRVHKIEILKNIRIGNAHQNYQVQRNQSLQIEIVLNLQQLVIYLNVYCCCYCTDFIGIHEDYRVFGRNVQRCFTVLAMLVVFRFLGRIIVTFVREYCGNCLPFSMDIGRMCGVGSAGAVVDGVLVGVESSFRSSWRRGFILEFSYNWYYSQYYCKLAPALILLADIILSNYFYYFWIYNCVNPNSDKKELQAQYWNHSRPQVVINNQKEYYLAPYFYLPLFYQILVYFLILYIIVCFDLFLRGLLDFFIIRRFSLWYRWVLWVWLLVVGVDLGVVWGFFRFRRAGCVGQWSMKLFRTRVEP